MQISAPIRIVAFVGLLAALGVGAWTFMAGSHAAGTSGDSQVSSVAAHPIAAAQSVASKLSAHNKATAAGKPDAVVPATQPKASPTPTQTPARHVKTPAPAPTTDRAPTTIASVLQHHRVAVVLLYDPQTKVDRFSLGEAQLGAAAAKAGFLRVDVLNQHQSEPFAKAYGVLQVPTLLFFARPGKLVQKLVGFSDQDTVAQAAFNAAHGLVATG